MLPTVKMLNCLSFQVSVASKEAQEVLSKVRFSWRWA